MPGRRQRILPAGGSIGSNSALQNEITTIIHRLKSGAQMRTEQPPPPQLVESLRTGSLRVAAEAQAGASNAGSLARVVEAIAGVSAAKSSPAETSAVARPAERRAPAAQTAGEELARASRAAQGRVGAILESERDPNRQWQRIVAMIDEDAKRAPRDIEVDLSDNSFLYSR